jgi:eukaryotic-like serine/threonine-protein kinase
MGDLQLLPCRIMQRARISIGVPTVALCTHGPNPRPTIETRISGPLKVDPKTGEPQTKPRQMTGLPGFGMSNISVSSDGKKMTVQKSSFQCDAYIGRLQADGKLETPRRLTSDERDNRPWAWTLDSKSVVFTSDRTGVIAIYRQRIDQDLAELLPTGPERVWLPRVTPDGSSIVYFAFSDIQRPWESRFTRLMRVPVSGGPRELVKQFSASGQDLDCPIRSATECVFAETTTPDRSKPTFFAFNPLTGKFRELFTRAPPDTLGFTVSPDGAHIGQLRGDTIVVLSLTGQIEQTIQVKGWPYLGYSLDWTADGNGFLLNHTGPTRSTLLRVGRDGSVRPIWEMRNSTGTYAIASPDGQYLAIGAGSVNSNAWLIENF